MKSSQIIAVIIAVVALGWILSGSFGSAPPAKENVKETQAQQSQEKQEKKLTDVRVRLSRAEDFTSDVVVTGRTGASRSVVIRAETEGQIASLPRKEGERVTKGEVLAKLEAREREAVLAEARERVVQREIEYNASKKLESQGFNSRVRLAQTKADLEAARAALRDAQVELANISIKAPFDGVMDEQDVEIGDYLAVGDSLFTIVDLDSVEITGFVAEQHIGAITEGSQARAELVDGSEVSGEVTFIAPAANPETRTFRVEITVSNPDHAIKDGLTTRMFIPGMSQRAHKISPSILTLNDEGKIGVKIVDEQNRVQFMPVNILSDKPDHMWISGLPDDARIITVGQEFVGSGQEVNPVTAKGDGLL